MSQASEMFCKISKENDDKKNAGLKTPDNIVRYDDIVYGPYEKWNKLDVYRPKNIKGKLPVIVDVHGGGYVYGDKELYQFYCMDLALRGFAVINFTYRLAPDYIFPAPLEDTNMVIEWMYKNADKYEFDLNKVYLVGDSAGAHMVSLYAAICSDKEYAKTYDFKVPNGFKPNAVCMNCGAYDQSAKSDGEGPLAEMLAQLQIDAYGKKLTVDEQRHISLCFNITKDFPPCYVMTATGDFLLEQVKYIKPKLEELNIEHVIKIYGDDKNLLPHVFHCDLTCPDAKICNDEEMEFLKKY